ncbi:MAG TPA: hypothetical protein ENH82_18735 [bacterium]|nr:hypothetical protein [bacterium]
MSWEICPKCGFRGLNQGEHCFGCGFDGSDLKICPDCGKKTRKDLKLCAHCSSDFNKKKVCPACEEENPNVKKICSKCGFDFQNEKLFSNVTKNVEELKQLLESNLISKNQFSSKIVRMIKQKVVINLTLVEAKYFLGLIKSYEKESVIERSTYDKISDYILENCFYVLDSKEDKKKGIDKEQQIKSDINKPGPVERNNLPPKDKTTENHGFPKGIGLKITLTAVTILIGGIVAGIIDETVGFGRALTAGASVLIIIWIWKR